MVRGLHPSRKQSRGLDDALGMNDAALGGVPDQLAPVVHAQLFHQVATMCLYRLDTDAENVGDFLVGVPFGD